MPDGRVNRLCCGGYSLIELMVVVSITSILATIGFPLAEIASRHEKEAELRRSLREIRTGIDVYKKLVDSGVIARQVGASGYPPDLRVLVDGVHNSQAPDSARIYILRRIPPDPFAESGADDPIKTWGVRSYASPPDNPSPGADVFDVYSRSSRIGLDGRAYKQW